MTPGATENKTSLRSVLLALLCSGIAILAVVALLLKTDDTNQSASDVIRVATTHVSAVPPQNIDHRTDELAMWVLNAMHDALADTVLGNRENRLKQLVEPAILAGLINGPLAVHGLEDTVEGYHEVELLSEESNRSGDSVEITAQWRTVGLLQGADHRHRLGNTFSGNITVVWAETEWRVKNVNVTAVDSTDLGRVVEADAI